MCIRDRSEAELAEFLKTGRNDKSVVFGGMSDVVEHSLQYLSAVSYTHLDVYKRQIGNRTVYDGTPRSEIPAEERNLGLVFQSYALWPHKTVFDNVAYPLKLRKVAAGEIKERVQRVLDQLGLGHLGNRHPHGILLSTTGMIPSLKPVSTVSHPPSSARPIVNFRRMRR